MSKIQIGKIVLGNFKLRKLFKNSYLNYLEIEKELRKDFDKFGYSKNIFMKTQGLNFIKTFQSNFFTLLMLSGLDKSGVEKQKLIEYGKVIFCLRTIVTCTDNIIDNEEKGVVFLKNIENIVVKNTMLLMTVQNVMTNILIKLGDDENKIINVILNKIYSIAESEGLRDRELYDTYPTDSEIKEKIHKGIGGELLQLSLISAEILEENKLIIEEFNSGLFHIGMSLQSLDDLCDMREDYEAGKINLATSRFLHQLDIKEERFLEFLYKENLNERFKELYREYLDEAINEARIGFDKFVNIGYPITEKDSLVLMKLLFDLRGMKDLWDLSTYCEVLR